MSGTTTQPSWWDQPDPFAQLPALAERLGVAPIGAGSPPTFVVTTKDGCSYDLFKLVNALLDRLDVAAPRASDPAP